ncbi:MAG: MFS transporter [Candidatus Eisenbacteria bacterium]|uniref:MFS transporter n=1 Tax=Eiseniibacteriota bacterium TaxID=2212470 RepID=A0A849SF26_UNCEI|nr:MFS transporter [Candidatus Eisenbacteria bacterium]
MKPVVAAIRDFREAALAFTPPARRFLATIFLSFAGFGVHQVLFNLYLVQAQWTEGEIGRAIALNGLGVALGAVPSAWLAERWGRRRAIVAGTVLDAIALGARALMTAHTPVLAASFVAGLAQSMIAISAAPFITEHSSPRERTHLFSAFFASELLAAVLGSMVGGWLPNVLMSLPLWPSHDIFSAYRVTLVFGAVIEACAILPLAMLAMAPEPPMVAERGAASGEAGRRMIAIAAYATMIGIGAGLVIPFMNLYFANRFQCSSAQIGTFFSIAQVITALASLAAPAVARSFGRLKTAYACQLLSLPFLVTLGFEKHLSYAVAAFLIRATLMQATTPLFSAFVMEALPINLRARATSLINLMWNAGWAASATAAGFLIERFGYDKPFYVTACLYLVGATWFYLRFRSLDVKGDGLQAPPPIA